MNPPNDRPTWQQAQRDAEQRAAIILEQIASTTTQHGQAPAAIPLTDYPTSHDFAQILGDNPGWSWEHWTNVNRAVKRILNRHKYKVHMVPMHAPDFFQWLQSHKLNNNPANRARYAAETCQKNNP